MTLESVLRCHDSMATFGHLAAGAALSRLIGPLDRGRRANWQEATVVTVVAAAPDIDFLLPIRHRGVTHSLGFAAAITLALVAIYARSGMRRALAMAAAGGLAAWSHTLLDLATGESGAQAAWPAIEENVALPAAPLPAMPVSSDLLAPDGLRQALGELLWAAPLAVVGLWPWRAAVRGGGSRLSAWRPLTRTVRRHTGLDELPG